MAFQILNVLAYHGHRLEDRAESLGIFLCFCNCVETGSSLLNSLLSIRSLSYDVMSGF